MQEFFYTILAIWVITRLFNAFSGSPSSSSAQSQTYQQTNNFYSQQSQQQQQKTEGEIKIETKKSAESKIPPTEGEYVDYEDIK